MEVDIYVKAEGIGKLNTNMSVRQFMNLLDAVNRNKFVSVETDFQIVCINTDTILRITAIKE